MSSCRSPSVKVCSNAGQDRGNTSPNVITKKHRDSCIKGDNYSVEVTIPLNGGMILRGEDMSRESFYEAVDAVSEKLERQVRKYRTRLYRKFRNQGLKALIAEMGESGKKEEEATIVKTKRFMMKPMPVDEAILQMNLLGHDFYVFRNAETEQVNVLYKRKDGNYGLIEPEV